MLRPAALLAVALAALVAACAGSRPADERAVTRDRLADAPTPEARAGAVAARLAETGLAPLADGVFAYGTPPVVAGFVPGHDPLRRGQLVVLAAPLSGPDVPETVEAGRLLLAAQPDNRPSRSVLVALWPAGATREAGLEAVRRLPIWPDSARVGLVVGGEARSAEALADAVLRLTERPARPDTLAPRP